MGSDVDLAKKVSKAIQSPPLNNSKTTLKRKPSSSSEESSDDDDLPVTKIPAVSKISNYNKKPRMISLHYFRLPYLRNRYRNNIFG